MFTIDDLLLFDFRPEFRTQKGLYGKLQHANDNLIYDLQANYDLAAKSIKQEFGQSRVQKQLSFKLSKFIGSPVF